MTANPIHDKSLHTRALHLSYFTVGYNLVEGIVSITAGLLAGSGALVGFGFDSFIESLSGSVMIWRFRKGAELSEAEEERIENIATKLVSVTFFILGAYVLYESITSLINSEIPERSLIGRGDYCTFHFGYAGAGVFEVSNRKKTKKQKLDRRQQTNTDLCPVIGCHPSRAGIELLFPFLAGRSDSRHSDSALSMERGIRGISGRK